MRKVVAMQISAVGGDQAGAPFAAHQGEKSPTARARIGVLRDIGNAADAASPYGSAYAYHVRSSGSPESASSSRFEACATSKQPTRWAPRKSAYVQSAPTSRQCLPGTFKE